MLLQARSGDVEAEGKELLLEDDEEIESVVEKGAEDEDPDVLLGLDAEED